MAVTIPRTSYFICTTRRSGSWLLAGGLEDTRVAGHPSEWFNDQEEKIWCERWGLPYPHVDYKRYLDKVREAGMAGTDIFGAKCLGVNLLDLAPKLGAIAKYHGRPIAEVLPEIFPNLRYIWLTREDRARQAISLYRAIQSGHWFDLEGHINAPAPKPQFDAAEIWKCECEIRDLDNMWHRFFHDAGIDPLPVVYEELAENYEETVRNVLRFLDVPTADTVNITPPRFKKQSDSTTDDWVERYRLFKINNNLR
ncbi:MAG TPA: Stf0 family sulfotransferase [Patescibacteria group bacterium]|nr:Stf0 family sulfotransferase [Patescibacteria group bacterium]